jgi:hypothetical protein
MTPYLFLGPLILVLIVILPWYRHNSLMDPSLDSIPCHRFRGLEDYLKDTVEDMPCADFWATSKGLSGVLARFRHMVLIVRLMQQQVRAGHVERPDATYIWHQAALQAWFSMWALPESALCAIWIDMPHACGLFALRCHYHLSLATITLCGTEGTQVGVPGLDHLL